VIARRTFQTVLAAALGPAHVVFSVDPGRGAIPGDHHKLPVVKNSFLDVSIVQILVHRGVCWAFGFFQHRCEKIERVLRRQDQCALRFLYMVPPLLREGGLGQYMMFSNYCDMD